MSNKNKGSKNERELYKMFVENNFRAVRVAGSGMMENADCDIIAGKKGNGKYAIEAKSTKQPIQYISKDQISRFLTFSEIFGLKPVIAVRFNYQGWYFFDPKKHLEDSGKNWGIHSKTAKTKGKQFAQFFKEKNKNQSKENPLKENPEFYDDLRDLDEE
ncbi:Holliday junction resolvase [archaeon]|mgnify:CR=1 FL=1|jgi:holliday junction resolvase Hjr|nr:Holliday junction resolvase [archaeon]